MVMISVIVVLVILIALVGFYLWATFFQPDIIAQIILWFYFALWIGIQILLVSFYIWVVKKVLEIQKKVKPTLMKLWDYPRKLIENL